MLTDIVQLAQRRTPERKAVSVTMLIRDKASTAAFSAEMALQAEELHYERSYGPCLGAARGRVVIRVADMRIQQRWPDYAAGVVDQIRGRIRCANRTLDGGGELARLPYVCWPWSRRVAAATIGGGAVNDGGGGPIDDPNARASDDTQLGTDRFSWSQRPPPHPQLDALQPWQWELTSAAQLTTSRVQLRLEVSDAGVPPGDIDDAVERLLLAYEELASNGFRHGLAPVHASVTAASDGWLIDVTDTATDHSPTPAVDRDPALGGLGLHLVAQLSQAHGWAVEAGRKHVWAYVRVATAF
ncbi:ATP-binding protein [Blastococcus aurantiacus]|uniref:ATP-binding protein n=1 Tax=Blastococcus aurantiacus TaxID=1550231 RepID=UPI0034E20BE2